ncbi:hypothetical protein KHP07_08610 [Pseudomonas sp. VS40]|jgi:hypothetical protein|uniref:hypothetical protein n=1 Tax=unclassified Pseudomonas TaxID=196821 RepID=UPI001BDE1F5B|nr:MULTISPECIES: hypothetical protein [unclassified Pseudomonas]MBT1260415.1 hypothetical protein [Pseudomonas sp. VS40]MBT1271743.1 hypothetical protein [Pseudomonas sp. VS59]
MSIINDASSTPLSLRPVVKLGPLEVHNENSKKTTTAYSSSPESVSVVLSPEGKVKSDKEKSTHPDIDAAKLPKSIKNYLKAIRDLQEKIDKKIQELESVARDQSLSENTRNLKSQNIQIQISVFSNTLSSVITNMLQEESALKLDGADRTLAASLMAPK